MDRIQVQEELKKKLSPCAYVVNKKKWSISRCKLAVTKENIPCDVRVELSFSFLN